VAPRSEDPKLIIRVTNLELVQPICSAYVNVTDGQTDRQTDGRHTIAIPRLDYVHRAVKIGSKDRQLQNRNCGRMTLTVRVQHVRNPRLRLKPSLFEAEDSATKLYYRQLRQLHEYVIIHCEA